jgi:hypothetical protein
MTVMKILTAVALLISQADKPICLLAIIYSLYPTFRTLNSDREKLRGEKIQVSIKTNILRKKGI